MKSVFFLLSDGTPLTKQFNLPAGSDALETHPYPHVLDFSSIEAQPKDLRHFAQLIEAHGNHYHCLLKGRIKKPLLDEPRAGSTSPEELTDWVCLDVDYLPGATTVEDCFKYLPKALQDVSFVVQLSASSGIIEDRGFSAHIFMELSEPVHPKKLKNWLKNMNLHPMLAQHVRLNKLGTALKWPLDVTTCQNDKLIYIAPPIVSKNLTRRLPKNRIQYIKKRRSTLDVSQLDFSVPDTAELKLLNELRGKAGLRWRSKYNIDSKGVLSRPGDPKLMEVTGKKDKGDFVYLNLNGGDSWGYYHPRNNPEILYNFKGEPNYYIKELLPAYYDEIKEASEENTGVVSSQGTTYFAVSSIATGEYYVGWHNEEGTVLSKVRSLTHCIHFMKEHGQPVPDFIPRWTVGYDFSTLTRFDPDRKFLNLYAPTSYVTNARTGAKTKCPEIIERLIRHVLGNSDECYDHFMNWLAFIVQERKMTGTAWVLHGTQGTGKGVLVDRVIAPILGRDYVSEVSLKEFEKGFNQYAESSLLVLVDEAQITTLEKHSTAMERIKRSITNPRIDMTKKGVDMVMIESHMNLIFASNKHDPVEVDPEDRRINVAPRQNRKLLDGVMTVDDIKNLHHYLQDFAEFLLNYKVDRNKAATPLHTRERERLQELTRDTNESIADHILKGDLQFFIDNAPKHDATVDFELFSKNVDSPGYKTIVELIYENKPKILPQIWLEVLFYFIADVKFPTRHKFAKFAGHKGLEIRGGVFIMINDWIIPKGELPWKSSTPPVQNTPSKTSRKKKR